MARSHEDRKARLCPCCAHHGRIRPIKSREFPDGFVNCRACGGVYSTTRIHEEADYICRYLGDVDVRMAVLREEWELIEQHAGHGDRVLDLGFSTGNLLAVAKELGFSDLHGVEIDPRAADIAQERLGGGQFYCGDFPGITLPADYFDVITAIQTLMYVDDLAAWMNKIYVCLRPGGILYIRERNRYDLVRRFAGTPCTKLNVFTVRALRSLCKRCGLEAVASGSDSILRGERVRINIAGTRCRRLVAAMLGYLRVDSILGAEAEIYAVARKPGPEQTNA